MNIGKLEKLKEYKAQILYVIVGNLTTLINFAVYIILVKYLKTNIYIASALAWIAAVLFSFISNKLYVFNSKSFKFKLVMKEFILFVGGRAITGLFEIFSLPVFIKLGMNQVIFGVEGLLAKLIISIVVFVTNYLLSKFFVFKDKEEEDIEQI